MSRGASLAPVFEPGLAGDRENGAGRRSEGSESCPVCGQSGAREWLNAPDRLHGRREVYTLVRCPACSLVWLSNPPAPSEMHLHYTDAYDKLISGARDSTGKRWKERRADVARYKQCGALLDLGCSSGGFLEAIRGKSWELYGIEMSAESAKTAEAKTGAQVFVGDIVEAPFPPESFDVITCFDVLEHLYQPRRVMGKVAEWLRPGGIFYFQVPNIDSAEAQVFGTYWQGLELPRHLFLYSPASVRSLAKDAGLSVALLETRRNSTIGTSLRYMWDDVFGAVGIRRTPLAYRGQTGLPWRAARKLVRMTILRAVLVMAPLVGQGEAIHAIFEKTA